MQASEQTFGGSEGSLRMPQNAQANFAGLQYPWSQIAFCLLYSEQLPLRSDLFQETDNLIFSSTMKFMWKGLGQYFGFRILCVERPRMSARRSNQLKGLWRFK